MENAGTVQKSGLLHRVHKGREVFAGVNQQELLLAQVIGQRQRVQMSFLLVRDQKRPDHTVRQNLCFTVFGRFTEIPFQVPEKTEIFAS